MVNMKGVLTFVGKPKQKESRYGTYQIRYLGLAGDNECVITMTEKIFQQIFNDTPKSGDLVTFTELKDSTYTFPDGKPLFRDPKTATIDGHYKRFVEMTFSINDIIFTDEFVHLQHDKHSVTVNKAQWDEMTGVPTSGYLGSVRFLLTENDDPISVTVYGECEVSYRWNPLTNKREEHLYSDNEVFILNHNLARFAELVSDYEAGQKLKVFLKQLKALIQSTNMLTDVDLQQLINDLNANDYVSLSDARDYVRGEVWDRRYDEEYFSYLQKNGELVGYGLDGFFFKIAPMTYAYETPKVGHATYIFRGEPAWILGQLDAIREESKNLPTEKITDGQTMYHGGDKWRLILIQMASADKKEGGDTFTWFVDRIMHDDDGSGWYAGIDKYIMKEN